MSKPDSPSRGTLGRPFEPVNLNTATLPELLRLPGVNRELALRIRAARPYASVDDLRAVKGVTARLLRRLRPLVTADDVFRPGPAAASRPAAPSRTRPSPRPAASPAASSAPAPIVPRLTPSPAVVSNVNARLARRAPLSLRARWLLMQAVFYGAALLLIAAAGVGAWNWAHRPPPTPTPTITITPTVTPTPSITPSPTLTLTPSVTPSPTPSPTLTPTPTPLPTVPAGAGGLLFHEPFEPLGYYWTLRTASFARTELVDGRLQVTVQRGNLRYVFGSMLPQADFYYQAAARADLCAPDDHYGLIVRGSGENDFYLFGVGCDGRLRVQLRRAGVYQLLWETPIHPAVQRGSASENLLAVRAVGEDFEFIVNGQTVGTVRDATLVRGQFGLYAKSYASGTMTVTFDDALAWQAR